MIDIEDKIPYLLTNAQVTNYPHPAPHEATFPNVTYFFVNPMNIRSHEGYVVNRERWQLNCWAYDRTEARDLFRLVKGVFDLNKDDFEISYVENEIDLPDAETGLFRKILEVVIMK
jgi:hypothetical protein